MIEVLHGDITVLAVDAVVNAANPGLAGGGGVDGAIHRAAGPGLIQACRAIGGCPPGEARVTPGFGLPARWIIHAVGPVYRGGDEGEETLLAGCYRHAFDLAAEARCDSIAFPCISTGAYGYPPERAAAVAIAEMKRRASDFGRIVACCFCPRDAAIYRQLLAAANSDDTTG